MPFNESPQEECGVFGIYKNDEELNVTEETYKALYTCLLYTSLHDSFNFIYIDLKIKN